MEKQKDKVVPNETPEQRPDLYYVRGSIDRQVYSGVLLNRGNNCVLIKENAEFIHNNHVGYVVPHGPYADSVKYTGPIDDEMMANILIYGG